MELKKVLFVCTHKGARSRIAEAFAKRMAPGMIDTQSSCFESGRIGPLPIGIMRELGIDMPAEAPKSVFKLHIENCVYDYVISICHEASTEQCPLFNTTVDTLYTKKAERISWSVHDFSSLVGTEQERKAEAKKIIEKIQSEVISFLRQIGIDPEIGG